MPRFLPLLLLLCGCQEYEFVPFEGVDVFFQNPPGKVDVLLVVDNSGSMEGWQLLVGLRFNEFLTYFIDADVDYHIGVTTTTVDTNLGSTGCTQADFDAIPAPGHLMNNAVITPNTENAEALFSDLVHVGACGSGDERGLEAARQALSPELLEGPSAGFIRDEAMLSVIFVSDEQDGSTDPVHDYVNDYYAVKGQRSRDVFNASALVITDAADCIVSMDPIQEGTRYMAVVDETDGVTGNLCNTNFEDIFTEISFKSTRLQDTFFLSEEPNAGTLTVSVDDRDVGCRSGQYSYIRAVDRDGHERPAILFDRSSLPRPSQQVTLRYNLGDGDPTLWCAE